MYAFERNNLIDDERGALTPLMLVLFISTGVALDLIRHDAKRSDLQDALDRGVLAAAALTQVVDAEITVREFLENRALSENDLNVLVSSDAALNYRRIDAGAEYEMNTTFLRMVGLGKLKVAARSAAIQGARDVEVSLVLDISGSMARENTGGTSLKRLDVLRDAASGFVDAILTPAAIPTTSLSLVPFSGQVNAGPLFDMLNGTRIHNYSSCTEFADSDFDTTMLPTANSRAQVPHFQWFTFEGGPGRNHEAEWGWCPSDGQAITPLSNDPDSLKAQIAGFVGHDGTGTKNGMKFGLGLLDPSSQPITAALVGAGTVDPAFETRPGAYHDAGRLKVIVVMTDGNIQYQQRPEASAYDTASERTNLASNQLASGDSILNNPSKRTNDEADRVAQFASLCDLAKQNGVIVFTIGFDVSVGSPAYDSMRGCASSASHFYDVDGLELNAAFQQIATTVSKL